MAEKFKVLHIITHMHVGGAQDNTLITVERHDRKKFDVTLMCSPEGAWVERAKQIPNLNIVFIEKLTRPIHPVSDVLAFFQIYRHLKTEKYDIVHTHSSKPGFLGRIAAKLAKVPVVVHTIHGFPFHDFMMPVLRRFFIFLEKQCAYLSDRMITVSNLNLKKTVELGIAQPEKLVNIYSGIDFRNFDHPVDRRKIRNELGIPEDFHVVGMIGRLSKQKSPWNLVKAAPLVLRRHPNTVFLSVGNGELQKEMHTLAHSLKLGDRFRFLGFREDIAELLHIFDVYTLPSQWEGLGRSLTEAMYMKKAVIASDVEGVPELVEHEKTGLLVPPNNPEKLAESIILLLEDAALRKHLGEKAYLQVKDTFEADKMVHDIEKLYAEHLLTNEVTVKKRKNGKVESVNPAKDLIPSSKEVVS
ncbi:MAG: glycosyltransferase family 4 protein [Deferribacteres bacterium]|nr:glycosyltransferase family 4 protein [candidate division KSB1 bacterium]MCB9500913.1 glycosyltransferase family 4 protein [Deferribacteres bacterium]